ncbi:MAG: WYL domain-containing protein [Lewinellaceae bacterium]|nr:WYL domain-containing protein [Lewinellaceae bacterium]
MTPRERVIKVLLRILSYPYRYTRRDLAQYFGVSKDAINEDIAAFRNIGLSIEYDDENQHRLAILPDREFKELRHLQPLSDEDKSRIARALDFVPKREAIYLRRKLESLYDFQRLGLRALRKPALDRIDRLAAALKNREQVILENYRSRSNQIRDRLVEPFHVDPEKDTLQAYDVEQKDSRHYRLSRIERVHLTGQPWQYKNDHRAKITDVFRIADNDQVPVHLHLDVFAYNSLTEEFPLTITYIDPGTESNTFELQCSVNHEFKGIQNFIMSNAQHVDIIYPVELRERVKEEAKKILGKLNAQ